MFFFRIAHAVTTKLQTVAVFGIGRGPEELLEGREEVLDRDYVGVGELRKDPAA